MRPVKNFKAGVGTIDNPFRICDKVVVYDVGIFSPNYSESFWLYGEGSEQTFLCRMVWDKGYISIQLVKRGGEYSGVWIGDYRFGVDNLRTITAFHNRLSEIAKELRSCGYEI